MEAVIYVISKTMEVNATNSVIQLYGRRALDNLKAMQGPTMNHKNLKWIQFLCAALSASLVTEVAAPILLLWAIESCWEKGKSELGLD